MPDKAVLCSGSHDPGSAVVSRCCLGLLDLGCAARVHQCWCPVRHASKDCSHSCLSCTWASCSCRLCTWRSQWGWLCRRSAPRPTRPPLQDRGQHGGWAPRLQGDAAHRAAARHQDARGGGALACICWPRMRLLPQPCANTSCLQVYPLKDVNKAIDRLVNGSPKYRYTAVAPLQCMHARLLTASACRIVLETGDCFSS